MFREHFGSGEQLALGLGHELIIDNFAGGGGTSEGLEQAFGRPVDVAINHDPEALAMHAINHPHTLHLCESVWTVDPIAVTNNRPVALVWLSPDCKHFSKAKGGTPVAKHIRGLAWVGLRWIAKTKPRCVIYENVEEFQSWGPLVLGDDGEWYPDPNKRGKTFASFVRQIRAHGYSVEWRELRACDSGAPTIRKRLFLIARRDGLPIVWPDQSHAEPVDRRVLAGNLAPWRTAADCIDFDIPAPSVFGRERPLVPNTLRRMARGLWRHVITSPEPYIVDRPNGSADRLTAACLEQANGGFYDGDGRAVKAPLSTITASGTQQRLVMAYLVKYYSSGGQDAAANQPMHTLPTKGRMGLVEIEHRAAVELSEEDRAAAMRCADLLRQHLPERFGACGDLVTIEHAGATWVLVDIGLRMLKPRELFRAQGFPEHYVIDEIPDPAALFEGGIQAADPMKVRRIPLSATAQVRMCGNSVSPYQAKAIALANFGHETAEMRMAA